MVGCLPCKNPRAKATGEALIVEVKAIYKRANANIKEEMVNPPRKHCVFPERGEFITCFNSNLVIEPDSAWISPYKDKPIYDDNGNIDNVDSTKCLPASIAGKIGKDDATYPFPNSPTPM